MNQNPVKPSKKPYQNPTLRVYGDVQTVTKTGGNGTMNDGMNNKTH